MRISIQRKISAIDRETRSSHPGKWLGVVAACVLLFGCGGGSDGGGDVTIDSLLAEVPTQDDESEGEQLESRTPVTAAADKAVYEVRGEERWSCDVERVDLTSSPATFVTVAEHDAIYPGAVLQGNSLANGTPTEILSPNRGGELSISLSTTLDGIAAAVDLPSVSLAAVRTARDDLFEGRDAENFSDVFVVNVEQIDSEEDLRVKLKVKADGPTWGVKGKFSFSDNTKFKRFLLTLTQRFYTLTFTPPANDAEFFTGVDPNLLANKISADNPPVYVSSVTYGRLIYVLVETTDETTSAQADIKGTYDAALTSGEIEAGVKYAYDLKNINIEAVVWGGGSTEGGLTPGDFIPSDGDFDFENLGEKLLASQLITRAEPISYQVKTVKGNKIVTSKLATSYDAVNCSPVAAGIDSPILIWDAMNAVFNQKIDDEEGYHFGVGPHIDVKPTLVLPPSILTLWVSSIPDDSGSNNPALVPELNSASRRPHLVGPGIIEFDNIQHKTTFIVGSTTIPGPENLAFKNRHLRYDQVDLENKSYTMFAVVKVPSTLRSTVYKGDTPETANITNKPGWLFSSASGGHGLKLGFNAANEWAFGHGDDIGTSSNPLDKNKFQLVVIRYDADEDIENENARVATAHLYVNPTQNTSLASSDTVVTQPIQPLPGNTGAMIGAFPVNAFDPHPFGADAAVGFQIKRIEVYEGAVLEEAFRMHAQKLRDDYALH